MAIFAPGSTIGGISGKVGGLTFVNTRGSKVVRPSQRIFRPSTREQQLASGRMANATRAWRNLTDDQQNAWRTYAAQVPRSNRLGIARFLSGYQTFLKINLQANAWRIGSPDLPPVLPLFPITESVSFVFSVSSGLIMTTFPTTSPNSNMGGLYGRPLYRTSTAKFSNTYRLLDFITDRPESPSNVTDAWESVYALPVLNQAIALRIVLTPLNYPLASQTIDQTVNVIA